MHTGLTTPSLLHLAPHHLGKPPSDSHLMILRAVPRRSKEIRCIRHGMANSEHVDDGVSCNRDEVLLAFNHHHEIMGGIICLGRPLVVLVLTLVSRSVAACVHLLMSAWVFLWHAVHDGYLGNVPPRRLQVHGLLDQQCQQHLAKTFAREKR